MFEKEAEDSFKCKKVLYKWETDERSYIDGFKDGAEFGYNKANEWHYPSKCEYPKEVEMKNKQLTKAKAIIKEMLSILPKENIEGIYEITEEAERFISEVEK